MKSGMTTGPNLGSPEIEPLLQDWLDLNLPLSASDESMRFASCLDASLETGLAVDPCQDSLAWKHKIPHGG